MKQKIEWYREVLKLEPASRVFFPLAKLLAADGQVAEAVATLKHGMLKHPGHVEARLLLVELLFLQGANAELHTEIDILESLFAAYPVFWQAWSEHLSLSPALADAALSMRFFAAALQGKNVSWGIVIKHGLQALLGGVAPPPSPPKLIREDKSDCPDIPPPPPSNSQSDLHGNYHPPDSLSLFNELTDAVTLVATETPTRSDTNWKQAPQAQEENEEDFEEYDSEETISLRTRSMAAVLAEQGDFVAALDIYQELLQTATQDELPSLEARIEELSQRLGTARVNPAPDAGEKTKTADMESTRLVNLLELLAQRLEARACC